MSLAGHIRWVALASSTLLLPILSPVVETANANEASHAAAVQLVLPRAERAGTVSSAEVFGGTLEAVQLTLDPQTIPHSQSISSLSAGIVELASANTPVELVVIHGSFADTLAKIPRWATAPTGHVMAFTVNPKTGLVLETYVGDISPHPVGAARTNKPQLALLSTLRKQQLTVLAKRSHSRRLRHVRRDTPVARATTWGSKCSMGDGHHCYALAVWEMKGSEQVAGTEALQYTEEADVPTWGEGGFVTNEEWSGFYNGGSTQYWTEMGQAAGEYYNCCTIRWFWAYQNHSGYHEAQPSERFAIGRNEYSAYYQLAAGGGTWCFDIGPNAEVQVKCVGGFETYSKDLENGAEFAANNAPTNWGHGLVNWWKEHEWYRATQLLANETGVVSYNGMCVSTYAPVPAPGNINYGSYGHC
jgi:hypothetical protein